MFLENQGHVMTSEYYIPDLIDLLIENGEADVRILASEANWFGVTYQEDKPHVVGKLEMMIKEGIYPADLWK